MRTFKNTLSFTIALTSILFLLASSQAGAHDSHRNHRHYSNSHHKKNHHSKHRRHHNKQHRQSTYTHKHYDYGYSNNSTTVIVTDNYLGSTVVVSSAWCADHHLYHSHTPTTYYSTPYSTALNPIVSTYRTKENGQCYQVTVDSYGNKNMTLLDYRACY